jgi:hypothetical protein
MPDSLLIWFDSGKESGLDFVSVWRWLTPVKRLLSLVQQPLY